MASPASVAAFCGDGAAAIRCVPAPQQHASAVFCFSFLNVSPVIKSLKTSTGLQHDPASGFLLQSAPCGLSARSEQQIRQWPSLLFSAMLAAALV